MKRRVVITGLGTVTTLGVGFYPLWEALVAGRCGLGPISRMDMGGFRSRLGGEIKDLAGKDHVPKSYRKAVKVMARDTEIAVACAKAAVEDAGLVTRAHAETGGGPTTYPSERMGCHIGAGLIAAEAEELGATMATAVPAGADAAAHDANGGFSLRAWGGAPGGGGGMNNLQPLWMLKYLPNMLACHVTIIHGCEGPSNTITCAEASGLLSLHESTRVIERGDADVCFSGGAESKLSHMGVLRCELAGRLADTGDRTDGAGVVRPFDLRSPGTLIGEGGGILVLEEREAAARRGARMYAEVAGLGAGQSSPPVLPPLPEPRGGAFNDGLEVAIAAALRDAGIAGADIDAIVPQGCGVRALDAGELGTLRRVFGAGLADIPLVTICPFIGDLIAGNGAVQAAVAAMCLHEQKLPARLHAGTPERDAHVAGSAARATPLRHVLVCTSSLGGQNAAIVLRHTDN